MSTHKKTWICVRGCQYQPGGVISLGQLLAKPFEPSLPLLLDGPLPVDRIFIERTHQASDEVGAHSSLGLSFKLWASIDMLPIKTALTAGQHTTNSTIWKFDRIDTEIMVPRLQDIQNAVNRDEVVAHINRKMFDFRKRIYMVIGVRIVRGARLSQQTLRTYDIKTRIGVDLAAGCFSKTAANTYSFDGSSDFVFAYKVCEIHYGKDVHVRPHNKGDIFSVDQTMDEIGHVDDAEQSRYVYLWRKLRVWTIMKLVSLTGLFQ